MGFESEKVRMPSESFNTRSPLPVALATANRRCESTYCVNFHVGCCELSPASTIFNRYLALSPLRNRRSRRQSSCNPSCFATTARFALVLRNDRDVDFSMRIRRHTVLGAMRWWRIFNGGS